MFDAQNCKQPHFIAVPVTLPAHDPEASLRRASMLLEHGGLKEASRLLAQAADAIAEGKRRN